MTDKLTPTFIGIGAPRCGTRWLAECLAEHPEVAIAPGEVYYFTKRRVVASLWHNGPDWYENRLREAMTDQTKAVGEITPVYLLDDDTPELIHRVAPNAKLFCCLRDQSRRAESWYRLFLRFNPAISPEAYPIEKFLTYQTDVYGREGFYLDHLERYWTKFPKNQILVRLYDDLEADPASYIRDVYRFIGVNPDFVPDSVTRRINRLAPKLTGDTAETQDSDEAVARLRLPPALRDNMKTLYEDHNAKLGELLGRDLGHWNR